jgi:membrane protein implicated in regulation of membrane protease activity
VLEAARDGFTTAVNATATVGAVLFITLAIIAAVALRRIRPRRDMTPSNTES